MTCRRSGMLPAMRRKVTFRAMGELRRIVITGPESSGKTTLARALARQYSALWVEEMAREYLANRDGQVYVEKDLLGIARLQLMEEDKRAAEAVDNESPLLFCDTDLITIRIWGEEKYGRSDPWIVQQTEARPYDLWLLCSPDMPWEPDPLRENPHDRDRLFEVYERTLNQLTKPYAIMSGAHEERMRAVAKAIEESGHVS